jgi:hypothetical protein
VNDLDAATRYARDFLLSRPALVVLRAPTGYLKTSTVRIAAQQVRDAVVVDCRDVAQPEDLARALAASSAWSTTGAVARFLAFDNAEAALARPPVLAAIHEALLRRAPDQTIAICTRRPFPLPGEVLASAIELTLDDLAVDVDAELAERGLGAGRVAEIRALTLGWPMATYRLASIAAGCPAEMPLLAFESRALDRLLLDVRLDFVDRLPASQRERLLAAHQNDKRALREYVEPGSRRDLLASKLGRIEGILLRDGAQHRIPGIVLRSLEMGAATQPARPAADPAIVFDVLSGEIIANGEVVRLPRREYEVLANLAIKSRHVPYDVLLEEVWGDANDDIAKLKVTVGRLRKRFGFGTVQSVNAGFVAGANVTCSLVQLEEFAGGSALLAVHDVQRLVAIRDRYANGKAGLTRGWPWYTTWAAKVDALVERAIVALGRYALAHGDDALALECAREAIAIDEVGQDGHELAVRALLAQGNVVAARQLLARYTVTLRRVLDIALPERLERLLRDIPVVAAVS